MCLDRIKEKKKCPDIDSVYDYLSRTETFNIAKVSTELILNELVKENVLVSKKGLQLTLKKNRKIKKNSQM